MKKIALLLSMAFSINVYSQSLLDALKTYQNSLSKSSDTKLETTKASDVKATKSSGDIECKEDSQTSMQLDFLSQFILEKGGAIKVVHNPRAGTLEISAPAMISNCASMIDWSLRTQNVGDVKTYAVEAKIKSCSSPKSCTYKVAKMKDGMFDGFEEKSFEPTQKGFYKCIESSGIIVDGKVVPGAIYQNPLQVSFDDVNETGQVLFVSHGPEQKKSAKYGNFVHIDKCDAFEVLNPSLVKIKSKEEEDRERLSAEASQVRGCGEYEKVADFISRNEDFANEFAPIRDKLILEAAKKSAKNISEGNATEEDMKVVADFEKYIVRPKIENARYLYNLSENQQGSERKQTLEQLKKVSDEIVSLSNSPYFTSGHVEKLVKEGKFDEATTINRLKLFLQHNQRLGTKQNNVVLNVNESDRRIVQGRNQFDKYIDEQKDKYEVRTGQVTGRAKGYAQTMSRLRQSTERRISIYNQEIQSEYARFQSQNGHCNRPYVNRQNCINDSLQRINELQSKLNYYNKLDTERMAMLQKKVEEYSKLEEEGRRVVASQGGSVDEFDIYNPNESMPTTRAPDSAYVFNPSQQGNNQYQNQFQQYQNQQYQTNNQFNPNFQSNYQYQYSNQNYPYQNNSFNPMGLNANFNYQFGNQGGNYQYGYNNQQNFGNNYGQPFQQNNPYNFNPGNGGNMPYQNNYQQQMPWQQPSASYNNSYSFYRN